MKPFYSGHLLLLLPLLGTAEITPEQREFFESKIRPILVENCHDCHSVEAGKQKAGLLLDSKWGWETGGDSGPAIVPGDLDKSILIDAVRRTEETVDPMPPKHALPPAEVALLERWVREGAPDPRPKVESASALVEEFNLEKRFQEHWSWRPVTKPDSPAVNQGGWAKSDLDKFVLARLEAAGLRPALPADKRTWLRRVTFDLIGLPPTREEIANFLADRSPGAHEKVVVRLLDSPHFGEKWARHWMDLVRYAETCGHEFDYPIPHAHQYRDYLIRAFNADVPYDQFVREHIAGDLLPKPRRHPEEDFNESVIGTGFWYFHDATHAPTDVLEDEAGHLDNQLDVFGKAFQGLTISCARCHDHKFDAISTADYYALTGYIQGSCRTEIPLDPGRQIEMQTAHQKELRVQAEHLLRNVDGDRVQLGAHLKAAVELLEAEAAKPKANDPWDGETFEDFEGDFARWKIEGNAFGNEPSTGHPSQKLGGVRGKTFASSFAGTDKAQGKLTSKPFTIRRPYINFLIAGGKHRQTRIDLIIEGKPYRTATGDNTDVLKPESWSVSVLAGKTAVIQITDEHRGGWGHINVDHIVFSEAPADDDTIRFPADSDIAAIAAASGLHASLLKTWCSILAAKGKDARSADEFWPQWLAKPNLVPGLRRTMERDRITRESFEKRAELFADFSGDELPEGWTTTGFGFQAGDNTASLAFGDEQRLLAAPGVANSGGFGANHVGTLRSPTFPIPDAKILVKTRARDVMMRVVPSNYHMALYQPLLFKGTIHKGAATDTEGTWRWLSFGGNLDKYVGQNAYLEFVDSGKGSVAIDEIWFEKEGILPVPFHPLIERVIEFDDLAEGLDRIWSEIIANLRQSSATAADADIVNWFARQELITAADLHPDLAVIHEEGLKTAAAIRIPEFAVTMTQGTPENARVYIRGKHFNQGEEVPNRYLEVFDSQPGTRLDLARQIANPENPLTSRVMVNRIWHYLFGSGLVPTVDDFGPQGQLPSHPDLLDWLARDFVSHGWSVKHTIREIVLSQTYLQDSVAHPALDPEMLAEVDPKNILLHRKSIRRLQAEAIRDAILAVSGQLDPTPYGPSIPTHRTAFMTGRGARGSGPLDGEGRRSIYGAVYRNFLSPFMLTFDQPTPFGPKGRRSTSNVPAQALVLMNDPFVIEQAKLWAKAILSAPDQEIEARLSSMVEVATGREAGPQQLGALRAFLDQQAAEHGGLDERSWGDLAHALFNTKDFLYLN